MQDVMRFLRPLVLFACTALVMATLLGCNANVGGYGMGGNIVGLVILILDILAIIQVVQSGISTGMKLVWILVILCLPLIGMILWFVIGRK